MCGGWRWRCEPWYRSFGDKHASSGARDSGTRRRADENGRDAGFSADLRWKFRSRSRFFNRLSLPAGADLARYRASLSSGRGLAAADFDRDGNSWANDSVWVQFSSSSNAARQPAYRIGTPSGLAVNLEECVGCGVSGWGWEDDGWGAVDRNGGLLRFDSAAQRIFIQTREDGVSIDQIVLSAERYLTARPGGAKNDHTILAQTQ